MSQCLSSYYLHIIRLKIPVGLKTVGSLEVLGPKKKAQNIYPKPLKKVAIR